MFPVPPKDSIIYEDKNVYACLALEPIADGHTVVVWKRDVKDIHDLSCDEYEHLMSVVDLVRDTMLEVLKIEKVYLVYMDEVKHVHWHLVPRRDEKGFNVFSHKPKKVSNFPLAASLRDSVKRLLSKHGELNR